PGIGAPDTSSRRPPMGYAEFYLRPGIDTTIHIVVRDVIGCWNAFKIRPLLSGTREANQSSNYPTEQARQVYSAVLADLQRRSGDSVLTVASDTKAVCSEPWPCGGLQLARLVENGIVS